MPFVAQTPEWRAAMRKDGRDPDEYFEQLFVSDAWRLTPRLDDCAPACLFHIELISEISGQVTAICPVSAEMAATLTQKIRDVQQ